MTKALPIEAKSYAAFLFDMDGTILTSIAAAERVWSRWALSHGIDVHSFLPTIHGMRAVDVMRRADLAGLDVVSEAHALSLAEIADVEGIQPIAGAAAFLASLPPDRFAIVTSAPRALAVVRLAAAGITPPETFITAEDVVHGKPSPEGFQLAARKIGCDPRDCLIFEDAPAGIAAAEAAGGSVAVVTATHSYPMETEHFSFADYDTLATTVVGGKLKLTVRG